MSTGKVESVLLLSGLHTSAEGSSTACSDPPLGTNLGWSCNTMTTGILQEMKFDGKALLSKCSLIWRTSGRLCSHPLPYLRASAVAKAPKTLVVSNLLNAGFSPRCDRNRKFAKERGDEVRVTMLRQRADRPLQSSPIG